MKKSLLILSLILIVCSGCAGTAEITKTKEAKQAGEADGELQYFEYYYYELDPMFYHQYVIEYEDGAICLTYQDGFDDMVREKKRFGIEQSVLKDVSDMIAGNRVDLWDGWDKTAMVTDAWGFGLTAKYENSEITAKAYAQAPDNFNAVNEAFEAYFQELIREIGSTGQGV